jgi:hypothetical protein
MPLKRATPPKDPQRDAADLHLLAPRRERVGELVHGARREIQNGRGSHPSIEDDVMCGTATCR